MRHLEQRPGMTLTEVLVALGLLAAVGGPLIASMLTARRGLRSSAADVQAAVHASRMAERLAAVPPGKLPLPAPGLTRDEAGRAPGVPRTRWGQDLVRPPEGVTLEEVVGAADPEGLELGLWFAPVPAGATGELGEAGPEARQILVTVSYQATPDPAAPRRHLSVLTLSMEDP